MPYEGERQLRSRIKRYITDKYGPGAGVHEVLIAEILMVVDEFFNLSALEERVAKLEAREKQREETARKAKEEVDAFNDKYIEEHPNTLPSIRRAMGKPVCEYGDCTLNATHVTDEIPVRNLCALHYTVWKDEESK
jgi:hypothetical protein